MTTMYTRSPPPEITPFPREPITPLWQTRPRLSIQISRARIRAQISDLKYKKTGKLNTDDPVSLFYRKLVKTRVMQQLWWGREICSKVFEEELRDLFGKRYTIENRKRQSADISHAFETNISFPAFNIRLEVAALERARDQKLRETYIKYPKCFDEDEEGNYVPAQPTLPPKPPSSPVRKYAKLPSKYRMRRRQPRLNGIWGDIEGGNRGEDEAVSAGDDVLGDFQDECLVS